MGPLNGTAVNFGFTGTNGIALTGTSFAGFLLQSAQHSAEADKEDIRNAVGDIVARGWYDQHIKAELEVVFTAAGIAAAITATTIALLTPGTILVITACASDPDLVASTWEVMSGAAIKGSNTTAKRLTIPLEKRAGITGVAGA